MGELLIILAIVVLLFGARRLPEIASGMGKAIRNFKRGIETDEDIDVTPAPPDKQMSDKSSAQSGPQVQGPPSGQQVQDAEVQDAEVVEPRAEPRPAETKS